MNLLRMRARDLGEFSMPRGGRLAEHGWQAKAGAVRETNLDPDELRRPSSTAGSLGPGSFVNGQERRQAQCNYQRLIHQSPYMERLPKRLQVMSQDQPAKKPAGLQRSRVFHQPPTRAGSAWWPDLPAIAGVRGGTPAFAAPIDLPDEKPGDDRPGTRSSHAQTTDGHRRLRSCNPVKGLVVARGSVVGCHSALAEAKTRVPGLRTVSFGEGEECPHKKVAFTDLRVVA